MKWPLERTRHGILCRKGRDIILCRKDAKIESFVASTRNGISFTTASQQLHGRPTAALTPADTAASRQPQDPQLRNSFAAASRAHGSFIAALS